MGLDSENHITCLYLQIYYSYNKTSPEYTDQCKSSLLTAGIFLAGYPNSID